MRRSVPLLVIAVVACRGERRSPPAVGDPSTAPASSLDARIRAPHPVTPALLDTLAALAVPGHQVQVLARGASDLALAITAADGTRALATASACLGCVALDLERWRARRAELASLWAPSAEAESPAGDARLAIASLELGAGEHAIAIDARRADGTAVTVAHWNDGILQLQAVCEQPAAVCTPVMQAALAAAVAALP